ncbi:MAG: hypothetical protein PQJ59_06750 [Spirochaetales bacterium]|nr:hypothetical protein [Spirochaetales bacterium]
MDNTGSNWHKLKCYMETEKILLTSFMEKNKDVRLHVRNMDWPTLEVQLHDLDDYSCQIQEMDRRRHKVYEKIKNEAEIGADFTFFDLTAHLPKSYRSELRSLHGELKVLTDRIKIEGRITSAYVEARSQALKDMLGELIPETKNLFYSPTGHTFKGSTGTSSLLVNRSL